MFAQNKKRIAKVVIISGLPRVKCDCFAEILECLFNRATFAVPTCQAIINNRIIWIQFQSLFPLALS